MSVTPSPIGGFAAQFFDNNGVILSGGKIYTYAAGTTTPQATYTSASGVTPHANPIILDSAGRVPGGEIWLTDGLVYKFVIETSTGSLLGTYDNITGVNSNFVNYTVQEEVITATAGQTVFNLTTINYTPGTNSLTVYIDGVNQYVGDSYLETDSDTVTFTAGLHVGAEVKFTTAVQSTTGAVDSSIVSYEPPFTNSVATNVENKLSQTVSVQDFGAVGDGVADDTAAIQTAIATVNSDPAITTLIFEGVFLVDYLSTGVNNILCEITRDDLLITGGGTIKAKTENYGSGVGVGAFKYYTTFQVTGNRVSIENIEIDGDNQFSQYASDPAQPNYWLNGIYFLGTNYSTLIDAPQARNVRYVNGGGWPIRGTYCFGGNISNCYVENSQGVGFDGSSICVVDSNTSFNSYDAHFATWNSIGAVVSNNTCNLSSNGSGIDVSGSKDCTVIGNTIRACANRGIWVLQDPNTSRQPSNVSIIGNAFFNNNSFSGFSERGDIQVAEADPTVDPRPVGTVDVRGLTISGNTFYTYNNANCITLGKYAFDVNIVGNTFADQSSSSAARSIVFYNSGQANVGSNNDLIYLRTGNEPKVLGAGPISYDDANAPLDTSVASAGVLATKQATYTKETTRSSVAGQKFQIDERFGYSVLGAEFNSANGSVDVAEINFTSGGFEVADITVIVTVGGNRGVRRSQVTYQGYSSVTPTQIVAAASAYSGGGTPPTITFTAATGKVTVSVGSDAILGSSIWMRVSGTSGTAPNVVCLV
jgi:parallel beta-helix repeat protein